VFATVATVPVFVDQAVPTVLETRPIRQMWWSFIEQKCEEEPTNAVGCCLAGKKTVEGRAWVNYAQCTTTNSRMEQTSQLRAKYVGWG